MAGSGWEHFHHVADVGIRGKGQTPAQAFEQAAIALTAVVVDPEAVAVGRAVELRCEAPDLELLLVDWLNAVLFQMAAQQMLFGRFEVRIEDGRLVATAHGETLDPARHRPVVEVKAATYSELAVARQDDGSWVAQCVVDV